jgi:GT2 family glycosyltransferase
VIAPEADLTIVVAPREKYGRARDVFRSLLEVETPPFRLVWVDDARAPRSYRRWIGEQTSRPGVRHLALAHRAGANECRMRGFAASSTPFVLFLDNDAFVGTDAIANMMDCMAATNASFVAPLTLEIDGSAHHAGGRTAIISSPTGKYLHEELLVHPRAEAARGELVRARTDALEMHAVLVRAASLVEADGLDTGLVSSMDCADLSLRLKDRHGSGWLEPAATVTYDSTTPHLSDLALFYGRWCSASVEHDIARFATSWGLDLHDARLEVHREFLRARRMRPVRYLRALTRRAFGEAGLGRLDRALESLFDQFTDTRLLAWVPWFRASASHSPTRSTSSTASSRRSSSPRARHLRERCARRAKLMTRDCSTRLGGRRSRRGP